VLVEIQQVEIATLEFDAFSASASIGLPELAFGSQ
jgi:hypothetical protein